MALEPRSWAWKIPHVAFHDSYEEISAFFFITCVVDLLPPQQCSWQFPHRVLWGESKSKTFRVRETEGEILALTPTVQFLGCLPL